MNLIEKNKTAFKQHFPQITEKPRFFSAPGRVNLIGEHTDYNDGFVLPAAIDFETVVAAAPRPDSIVHIYAIDKDEADEFDLAQPITPHPQKGWANYVRGMAKILLSEGNKLRGLNLTVTGNVPTSGGLSSSASFEMALGHAFLRLSNQPVDGVKLALSGQRTENEFVGVQCGIMDQYISSLGEQDCALLIDCRDLSYKAVSIPPNTAIVVVDSGVQRGLVDSEYNARRKECEAAAAHFGVKALRNVDEATFNQRAHELSPIIQKRARHVITENARTLAATEALAAGDTAALGPLMAASHRSMKEDFEITVPAIDTLVEIMQSVPGIYGARMTGGGFGGCCVALTPTAVADDVEAAINMHYRAKTGYEATVYKCRASAGAREVTP